MALAFDPNVATYLAQAGNLAKQVLAKVADESAVSGWSLARMLNADPSQIEAVVAELREKDLLGSNEPGLEGMYFLTQLGYLSRQMF